MTIPGIRSCSRCSRSSSVRWPTDSDIAVGELALHVAQAQGQGAPALDLGVDIIPDALIGPQFVTRSSEMLPPHSQMSAASATGLDRRRSDPRGHCPVRLTLYSAPCGTCGRRGSARGGRTPARVAPSAPAGTLAHWQPARAPIACPSGLTRCDGFRNGARNEIIPLTPAAPVVRCAYASVRLGCTSLPCMTIASAGPWRIASSSPKTVWVGKMSRCWTLTAIRTLVALARS